MAQACITASRREAASSGRRHAPRRVDREPCWNRSPASPGRRIRRLDPVVPSLALLVARRIPPVWPLRLRRAPRLTARLLTHGFEDAGAGIFMRSIRRSGAGEADGHTSLSNHNRALHRSACPRCRRRRRACSRFAEACAVGPIGWRLRGGYPSFPGEFHSSLTGSKVTARPARRRHSRGKLPIVFGTGPFRARAWFCCERGVLRDAIDAGSRDVPGVFADNPVARRMAKGLDRPDRGPAPDLILL